MYDKICRLSTLKMNVFVLRFKIDASYQMGMGYHYHVNLRNKDTQRRNNIFGVVIYDVLIKFLLECAY